MRYDPSVLCTKCGGDGVLPLRNPEGMRTGIQVCYHCAGNCYEPQYQDVPKAAVELSQEPLPDKNPDTLSGSTEEAYREGYHDCARRVGSGFATDSELATLWGESEARKALGLPREQVIRRSPKEGRRANDRQAYRALESCDTVSRRCIELLEEQQDLLNELTVNLNLQARGTR